MANREMTKQEAIDRILDHMQAHHIGEYPHLRLAVALDMAIAALREQEQNQWRSAKDDPPICGERVIATDGVFAGEAYRTSADSWYRQTGFPWRESLGTVVTHWMPLPKPAKESRPG